MGSIPIMRAMEEDKIPTSDFEELGAFITPLFEQSKPEIKEEIAIIVRPEQVKTIDIFDKPVIVEKNAEIPDFLKEKLRSFQIEGVEYAIGKRKCFIADEMGLGKSIQALATVESLDAYPCLIVCPASLKYNWQHEINKWLPDRTDRILSGDGFVLRLINKLKSEHHFIIINYDILRNFSDDINKWGFKSIIFDESHYLKNADAKRTNFASKIVKDVGVILMLTGTAILNRPIELLPQMKILDALKFFGGAFQFQKDFVQQYGLYKYMVKNLDILNERMRKFCYVRRTKSEVLTQLPPKQRTYIQVDLDNYDEYKLAKEDLVAWMIKKSVGQAGLLALTNRSSSVRAETLAQIEYLKQICARGKLKAVIERIEDFLEESDEKLIIFATHIEIQQKLIQHFEGREEFSVTHILGSDSLEDRDRNVQKFQNNEKCRLMICSLQAGGLGLNLTAASHIYKVELGWNPAVHDQAEDRAHRIGQDNPVFITYFLGKDTIDEWIFELIEKKRMIVTATIDGGNPEEIVDIFDDLIAKLRKS